jgi:hypothetical protein
MTNDRYRTIVSWLLGAVVALSSLGLPSAVWAQEDADDDGGTIFDITGDEHKDPSSIDWENMPRAGQDIKIAYDKKIVSLRKAATDAQQKAWDAALEEARKVWAETKTAFGAAKTKAAAEEAYEEATKLRNAIQAIDRSAEDTATLDPLEVCVTNFVSEDARKAKATYDKKIAEIGKKLGREVARIAGDLDDKAAPPYKKFLDDLDAARKKAISDGRPASAQKIHDALSALPADPPANPPIVLEGQTAALKIPEPPEEGADDDSAASSDTDTTETADEGSTGGDDDAAAGGEGTADAGEADKDEEEDKPAAKKRDRSKPLIELAKDKLSKSDYRAVKTLKFTGLALQPISPASSWMSARLTVMHTGGYSKRVSLTATVRYLCINDEKKKVVVKRTDTLYVSSMSREYPQRVGDVEKGDIADVNNGKLTPYNIHVEVQCKGVPIWEGLWKKKGKVAKFKADGETFWFDDESLVVDSGRR